MKSRALSLWQPWASLVACGLKTIETRTYPTRVRGPFVVCAALRSNRHEEQQILDWLALALPACGRAWPTGLPKVARDLPRGVAVATADLVTCRPLAWPDMRASGGALLPDSDDVMDFDDRLRLGIPCFAVEGRWAWALDRIQRTPPVPVRGKQGWFFADIPEAPDVQGSLFGAAP